MISSISCAWPHEKPPTTLTKFRVFETLGDVRQTESGDGSRAGPSTTGSCGRAEEDDARSNPARASATALPHSLVSTFGLTPEDSRGLVLGVVSSEPVSGGGSPPTGSDSVETLESRASREGPSAFLPVAIDSSEGSASSHALCAELSFGPPAAAVTLSSRSSTCALFRVSGCASLTGSRIWVCPKPRPRPRSSSDPLSPLRAKGTPDTRCALPRSRQLPLRFIAGCWLCEPESTRERFSPLLELPPVSRGTSEPSHDSGEPHGDSTSGDLGETVRIMWIVAASSAGAKSLRSPRKGARLTSEENRRR